MMAKALGISVSSVQRIWRAHGLQPHRVRQFKLSGAPQFAAKLRDIVGLYVDPQASNSVRDRMPFSKPAWAGLCSTRPSPSRCQHGR
jgi:hypothetical protein